MFWNYANNLLGTLFRSHNVKNVRYINKHWNPAFKKERRKKVLRIELPNYEELRPKQRSLNFEEARAKLKEEGIAPGRHWDEKPMLLKSTGGVIDPYVPPEDDDRSMVITKEGALQRMDQLTSKGRSLIALRKIRQYDEDFELAQFCEDALRIYKEAHQALMNRDRGLLHSLVTERCYVDMRANTQLKTIRWEFLQSLEPARVVHLRTSELITKENQFAQATMRFHSQQILAVYDRFGRLMHGSPSLVKDVLEYVVFEKHLSDMYGQWRMHAKVFTGRKAYEPTKTTHFDFVRQEAAQ